MPKGGAKAYREQHQGHPFNAEVFWDDETVDDYAAERARGTSKLCSRHAALISMLLEDHCLACEVTALRLELQQAQTRALAELAELQKRELTKS